MPTLVLEAEPVAVAIEVAEQTLSVGLADGRTIVVPLDWFPRLVHGTDAERGQWRLLGGGDAVEWPLLDEHIGVEGPLAGRRRRESQVSLCTWLESRAAGRT